MLIYYQTFGNKKVSRKGTSPPGPLSEGVETSPPGPLSEGEGETTPLPFGEGPGVGFLRHG